MPELEQLKYELMQLKPNTQAILFVKRGTVRPDELRAVGAMIAKRNIDIMLCMCDDPKGVKLVTLPKKEDKDGSKKGCADIPTRESSDDSNNSGGGAGYDGDNPFG